MRDIQPVTGYGTLNEDDAARALEGLAPGTYRASDLHARYSDAAREAGRVPAHPVALGQFLSRRGFRRRKRADSHGQAVVWDISPFDRS